MAHRVGVSRWSRATRVLVFCGDASEVESVLMRLSRLPLSLIVVDAVMGSAASLISVTPTVVRIFRSAQHPAVLARELEPKESKAA